jgi:hypothetical protein
MVVSSISPGALADPELHVIRAQAALVRTLLDELDEVAPPRDSQRLASALAAQTAEELEHLASRMMSAASSLAPQRAAELQPQPQPWIVTTLPTKD